MCKIFEMDFKFFDFFSKKSMPYQMKELKGLPVNFFLNCLSFSPDLSQTKLLEQHLLKVGVVAVQGSATNVSRVGFGPQGHFSLSATFFLFRWSICTNKPPKMILTSSRKLFFWSSPSILPKKVLNFGRRRFFYFWSSQWNRQKEGMNLWRRPTFLFWSAEVMAARWNLVTIGYGPLVQKVADHCYNKYLHYREKFNTN